MAGAFGFERGEHHRVSIQAGERVLLPAVRAAAPETLIVANGFSCREQIAQTTSRRALHPAQLLKMAIDERGSGRREARPERRYLPDEGAERRRAVRAGIAGTAALLTAGALAVLAIRGGRRR